LLDGLIEVKGFEGQGYQPLVNFGTWRVAALRYLSEIAPERINSMERHSETDEVFVLTNGIGMLALGGNGPAVDEIETITMDIGKIYNIKLNCWHNIILSEDAHVIVIENQNTGIENTEQCRLGDGLQQVLQQKASTFLIGHYQ
jgi:hypothetical protein